MAPDQNDPVQVKAGSAHRAHIDLTLTVNGEERTVSVDSLATLLRVLRESFALTGSKGACARGECGACTVLVGGRAVMSCITLAARVHDPVVTVEGLWPEIETLAAAFADHGAFQCGFCTPGQLVRCAALLADHRGPFDEERIRRELSGNICRCTGYDAIVESVLTAAESSERRGRDLDSSGPRGRP